jgi:hypothetical protein
MPVAFSGLQRLTSSAFADASALPKEPSAKNERGGLSSASSVPGGKISVDQRKRSRPTWLAALPQTNAASQSSRGRFGGSGRIARMDAGRGKEASRGRFARTAGKRARTRTIWRNRGIKECDCLYRSDRGEAFGDRRTEAGGALECRASGVIQKLGPLLTLTFPVSFRPTDDRRHPRRRNPGDEAEFNAIDIEFFAVKKRVDRNYKT